jgi:hypothetical protein
VAISVTSNNPTPVNFQSAIQDLHIHHADPQPSSAVPSTLAPTPHRRHGLPLRFAEYLPAWISPAQLMQSGGDSSISSATSLPNSGVISLIQNDKWGMTNHGTTFRLDSLA